MYALFGLLKKNKSRMFSFHQISNIRFYLTLGVCPERFECFNNQAKK